MITKYYSTKSGKKIFKGYRARPFYQGKILDTKYFLPKEKAKAQLWHDRILSLYKKGCDFRYSLEDAFKLYKENFSGSINGQLYINNAYKCLVKNTPHWLSKSVSELKPTDMSHFFRELDEACEKSLGRKRLHLQREVVILHAVFEHYKNEKNIDFSNPVTKRHKKEWAKAKGKRLRKEVVSHTPEEVTHFFHWLKKLDDPVYFHIAFWQLTSHRQRVSEILSLEWKDVDWDREIIWITGTMIHQDEHRKALRNFKQYGTKEGRTGAPIYFGGLNSHLKASLLQLRELNRSERWVFTDKLGNVPAYSWISRLYKKSGFFKEKYLATHKCRKTAITLGTILCGADMAKTHAGHSTWEAHGRYVNLQQTELNNPIPSAIAKAVRF